MRKPVRDLKHGILPLVAIASLTLLAACGGSSDSTTTDSVSGGPGNYGIEISDATLSVQVPAAAADASAAAIQAYAKKLGVQDKYSFVTQAVTNNSSSKAYLCDVQVITQDGTTVKFERAFVVVGNLPDSASTTVYNQGVALYNSLLQLPESVLPGATGSALYVGVGMIPTVKSVFGGLTSPSDMGKSCETELQKQ
jgi:hypothetical protein